MLRIYQIVFSIALICLAAIGATHQDFSIIFPPDSATTDKWLYTAGSILVIIGGLLVIINRGAFIGSLVCASSVFIFSYALKVIPIFAKSSFIDIINNAAGWETLAFVGGCMILANSVKRNRMMFNIGLAILSAWFLWAGIGHYEYLTSVASLIPGYVPFHLFWVYFCGICLMLLSIGLWIPIFRLLAAQLAMVMFFLWCVMLHVPNYFTHKPDNEITMDIFESLAFAAVMGIVTVEFTVRKKHTV